jgi:hypothetical protein
MIDGYRSLSDHRKRLYALRNKVGAHSEAGGHISNLIEQMRNYEKETGRDCRKRLEKFMAVSVAAIEKLTR